MENTLPLDTGILHANDILTGICSEVSTEFDINTSLQQLHENIKNAIEGLARELASILMIDIFGSNDEHFSVSPVFDSYGKGIKIEWIGTQEEDSYNKWSKTFEKIQKLNFMDFYQRNNEDLTIQNSIKLFTSTFKNEIDKLLKKYKDMVDKIINIKLLGLDKQYFDIMVSRQVLKYPVKSLENIVTNIGIFANDHEKSELIFNEMNNYKNDLVIESITIYRK